MSLSKKRYFAVNLLLGLFLLPVTSQGASLSKQRQGELEHLLKHDCGSCHGMTLKGGLGPSLLKKDLAPFSEKQLFSVIKEGRPSMAMPPWKAILTDDEIRYLVNYLKNE